MEKSFKYKALSVRSFVELIICIENQTTLGFKFVSDENMELVKKLCSLNDKELKKLGDGFLDMYDVFKKLTKVDEIYQQEFKYKPADQSVVNQFKFRLTSVINGLSAEMGFFRNTTEFAKFLFDAYILNNEIYLKIIKKYLFHQEHKVVINPGGLSKSSLSRLKIMSETENIVSVGGNINGKEK